MTEEPPELRPDESERVRRLLAGARHTGAVPDDVAARLDRTLASLADERREREERAVVSLATRRRRTVAGLLAAAVAVVALGVGLGQVVSEVGTSDDSAGQSTASGDTESQDGGGDASAPEPAEEPEAGAGDARTAPPRLFDGTFDADVVAARERRTTAEDGMGAVGGTRCDRPAWGEGRRVAVRYDGGPAVLVFREPVGAVQAVDLFRCEADAPLRSTAVAAP